MLKSDMYCEPRTASPACHAPYVGMTVGEAASRRSTARQRQGGDGTGAVAQTCHFPPQSYAKLYGKRIFFDTDRERIDRLDGRESRMNGRTEAERMAAEHEAANPPMRLPDAEREAVDRARIALRDMDHNAMTMQQIGDYESLCGLLERLA